MRRRAGPGDRAVNDDDNNRRAIRGAIGDLIEAFREERQAFFDEELADSIRTGEMDGDVIARSGSRTIRNYRPGRKMLRRWDRYSPWSPVSFISGTDPTAIVACVESVLRTLRSDYQINTSGRATGAMRRSFQLFVRSIGGPPERQVGRLIADRLPARPAVSIVAMDPGASSLESWLYFERRKAGMYHAAKAAARRWPQLSVRFDYVGGTSLGMGGGTLPRIQVANASDLTARTKRPGRTAKKFDGSYGEDANGQQ